MRVVWIVLLTSLVSGGSPPQLQPDAHNLQQVVVLGHNVTVRCPLLRPVDFVVWKHNTEELHFSFRYRPSHKGWLKIIHVGKGDAGRYTCQAVNGFGSVEANITLIVHEPNGESKELAQEHNFYPEADSILDDKRKAKPNLLESSRFRYESIQRPTGSSVTFKCLFDGSPKPKVYWVKNGQRLSQKDLNSHSQMNRWTLNLFYLKESDSGLYTCVGYNLYGSANRNFSLEVVGRISTQPEILGSEPVNVTVVAGSMATFHCRVKSVVKPHIQWLKQVKGNEHNQQLIFKNNENYKVLSSGETMEHQQGIYLNKLQIPNVQESNMSKYICLAANVQGYNVSTYYLHVLPPIRANRAEREMQKSPLPLTVIIISVVLLIGVSVLAVCLSRYRYTQVKKGQPHHQIQVEDPTANEGSGCLQSDSVSQVDSCASKSFSHYHHHQHHHHHYRF